MNDDLKVIMQEPAVDADACVIWLHGLGADGYDFASIVGQLELPSSHAIRFIFPHAPQRPITLNGGAVMPGWYDILGIGPEFEEDDPGIRHAQSQINSIIAHQNGQGIVSERIVLIGFSQGGAVVLQTGLRAQNRLGGIMALSTYLPLRHTVGDELSQAQLKTPIVFMHGTEDDVVPYDYGRQSYQLLASQQLALQWFEYPMEHNVCQQQCLDIGQFLQQTLT